MKNQWVSVSEKLPFDDEPLCIDWPNVVGEFLVMVELKNPDPNDEVEVMILWFTNSTKTFSQNIAGPVYEENHDWHVTHWMPVPKPSYRFSVSKSE